MSWRRSLASRSARPCPTGSSAVPTRSNWSTCPPRRCAAAWHTATSISRRRSTPRSSHYFRLGTSPPCGSLRSCGSPGGWTKRCSKYRYEHGIGRVWETRERVVVALTGGPEGETLIRRAERIVDSQLSRSSGAHLRRSAGRPCRPQRRSRRRLPCRAGETTELFESLGGSYHSVVGDHVPAALLDFARAENATQLVLGTSRRGWLSRLVARRYGGDMVELSGDIDVHMVTHEHAGRGAGCPHPAAGPAALAPRRGTARRSRPPPAADRRPRPSPAARST